MRKTPPLWIWIVATIFVFVIWGGYWFALLKWGDMPSRGQFGDMFGALNTLFAGLGFAGLVFTILAQQAQISASQDEQHRDREIQTKQMEIMNKQVEALQQQLRLLQDSARPVIKYIQASNLGGALQLQFKNVGVPFQINRFEVSDLENPGKVEYPEGVLVSDQHFNITFTREADAEGKRPLPRNFRFVIHYVTTGRLRGGLSFRLNDCTPVLEMGDS